MALTAEAIRLMADKGLTAADIAEIAEAMENPSRSAAAERQARYRARGGGKIGQRLRQTVFSRDDWRCVVCGSDGPLHCDHIVPLMKGGETTIQNLQTLCRECNSSKRDFSLETWMVSKNAAD